MKQSRLDHPGVTFVARRVAKGKIMYQMAVNYVSKNGIEQVHTLFPHNLATEETVKKLGYDVDRIKSIKGF